MYIKKKSSHKKFLFIEICINLSWNSQLLIKCGGWILYKGKKSYIYYFKSLSEYMISFIFVCYFWPNINAIHDDSRINIKFNKQRQWIFL